MQAVIDAVDKGRIQLGKQRPGLFAAAREALLLRDFVEPARVAAIARHQRLAPHPQPARDPDVDGVGFPERTPAHWTGYNSFWRLHVHAPTLTESEHRPLCAGKDSKVMAAAGAIGCGPSRPAPVRTMILYPAIDLKDGRCVRLERGEMDQATVFNDDPAAQARLFAAQGFSHLHIVDLNGAFAGRPVNAAAVEDILAAVSIPVQLGGGIRSLDTIETWLAKGVARVILGTVAVRDSALVREACRRFPGRVAVGIDARAGKVAVEGWAQASELDATELAHRFEGAGVAAVIYTDIDRDGVLAGLNLPATAALARAIAIPVIASGGLAGIADIRALMQPEYSMIAGAIAGRALYDGRLDAIEALSLIGEQGRF